MEARQAPEKGCLWTSKCSLTQVGGWMDISHKYLILLSKAPSLIPYKSVVEKITYKERTI